nr:retrovirus-related Pol polyprotein from transposon TNT 1-94 [Tanacetum cinerariifolium]
MPYYVTSYLVESLLDDDKSLKRQKERVKSIALNAKKESSDDKTSTSESDDEEYAMAVCLRTSLEPDEWIKDSGCSEHMTGNKSLFSTYKVYDGGNVVVGSNLKGKIIGSSIVAIRTDHGWEFDNEVQFRAYCDAQGITHNFSALRTPQSNGVAERKSRTLQEMSRTMLNEQSISQKFWCNAVDTSTYILKRILIRPILEKTPYKIFRGRKLSLEYFKVFGSKCFILNTKDYLTKFDPKSYDGVFLGYSQNSKAYVVLNKHTMKFEESLNVTFDESPPPTKLSPVVDDDVGEEEAIKNNTKVVNNSNKEDESIEVDEVVNIKESKNHPLEQVIGNDVWDLVPLPMSQTIIGTKWVFRNKLDKNGIVSRNKARLVAQGYNQQEGIDYDVTYAPLARLESIRKILSIACANDFKLYQMGVKSAFLNGLINEEIYVAQSLGFIDFEKPNYVYKLKKALYGLKQAPKAWYDRLKLFLLKHEYSIGMVDITLFTKKFKSHLIIVQIYVDDIIFGSTCQNLCDDFAKIMHDEFEMSMMGELNFFLDSKPTKMLMSTKIKLTKDDEADFMDNTKYRGEIMPQINQKDYQRTKAYLPRIHRSKAMDEEVRECYCRLESCLFHEGRFVTPSFIEANNMIPTFQAVGLECFLTLHEPICPRFEKGKRVASPSVSSFLSSLFDENEAPSFLEFYEELLDNEDLTDAQREKRGMFKCLNRYFDTITKYLKNQNSSKISSPNFKRKTARMSVKHSNFVNLDSSSAENQNEKTSSPPPRKKCLSLLHASSKSISSKSTYYTSSSSPSESLTQTHVARPPKLHFVIPLKLEPQELPPLISSPNNPYVSTMENWPPGPSNLSPPPCVIRPPLRIPHPPSGFKQLTPTQSLFVNINNNTPHLHNNGPHQENNPHLPQNLENKDFSHLPTKILGFVNLNDMPHLYNMFCQCCSTTRHEIQML